MEDKLIHYNITLRTITPLAIGADKGAQLSPDLDFVFSDDGKELLYLDLDKVEEAVLENDLLDEFIRQTSTLDNNRTTFHLKSFLSQRFGGNIEPFVAVRVRQYGLQAKSDETLESKIRISSAVKNAGQPYLPGSSLKGALRTAMLYDWLVNTAKGEPVLKRYAQKIDELFETHMQLVDLRLNRSPSNFGKLKDAERQFNLIAKSIFDEADLFGPLKKIYPDTKKEDKRYPGTDARRIRVADTQALAPDALEVYKLQRIRITPAPSLSRKGAAIPQVLEAIKAGQDLYTTVSIWPEFYSSDVLKYWKQGDFQEAFGVLSSFSKACIENELYELRDALDSAEKTLPFESEIEKLIEFYEGLQARAEAGAVFLRLGFGKTINDNSLMLSLLYGLEDQSTWRKYRRSFFKVRHENAFFPVTRTLTPSGKPMGWVEVRKQKEK